MVSSADRLLELGLDVSDHRNFRVVPVPTARHPKTKAEARRWEAEILFGIEQHMLSYAVAGVGAHVVYSAVEDGALVEALVRHVSDADALLRENIASLISRRTLDILALACSLWLLEPTGAMTASAADLDGACFNRMLYAFEINPLMRAHRQAKDNQLPEAARLASMEVAAGWSRAELSWHGKPGRPLRRALGEEEERFLQELPGASLLAWEDREPSEPLRSTGKRDKNLARRVAASLEELGNEDATKPRKLVHDRVGWQAGEADELLREFELRAMAQEWVKQAKLSEQEKLVFELDLRFPEDIRRIARELGKSEGHVRVVRKNYRDKLSEVRTASGL